MKTGIARFLMTLAPPGWGRFGHGAARIRFAPQVANECDDDDLDARLSDSTKLLLVGRVGVDGRKNREICALDPKFGVIPCAGGNTDKKRQTP